MRLFAILFTILSLFTSEALSQPVMELIEKNPAYASCNYSIYPDSIPDNLTPAPSGKRPFYSISLTMDVMARDISATVRVTIRLIR